MFYCYGLQFNITKKMVSVTTNVQRITTTNADCVQGCAFMWLKHYFGLTMLLLFTW